MKMQNKNPNQRRHGHDRSILQWRVSSLAFLSLIGIIGTSPAKGQTTVPPLESAETAIAVASQPATVAASNQPAHGLDRVAAVGPGDLLDITVSDCPELTRAFRVDPDGSIRLPLLSAPTHVNGLMPSDIVASIEYALRSQKIVKDPVVIVSVREYQSRPVSVVGAVNHPLTFQLVAPVTLVDAIARAGGLSPSAGSSIVISRFQAQGAPDQFMQTIPTTALLSASEQGRSVILTGGEEIRVMEASKFFVAGNVRHPGMFTMQTDTGMSIIKAIAMSEGLGPYSSKYAQVYRAQKQGLPREKLRVDLHRVLARKDPDVELHPDDILYIPESGGKKMTSRMFAQITGFAQTAGAGVLVYH